MELVTLYSRPLVTNSPSRPRRCSAKHCHYYHRGRRDLRDRRDPGRKPLAAGNSKPTSGQNSVSGDRITGSTADASSPPRLPPAAVHRGSVSRRMFPRRGAGCLVATCARGSAGPTGPPHPEHSALNSVDGVRQQAIQGPPTVIDLAWSHRLAILGRNQASQELLRAPGGSIGAEQPGTGPDRATRRW